MCRGVERLYRDYARKAKDKGTDFKLTIQKFAELIKQDCFYCGRPPVCLFTEKGRHFRILYNSVDRVKPLWGYISTNVVASCKLCNNMKSDLPVEVFLSQIHRVAKHLFPKK